MADAGPGAGHVQGWGGLLLGGTYQCACVHDYCSCRVSGVAVAIIAAVATVAIAAAGVGCIVFLKQLTTAD